MTHAAVGRPPRLWGPDDWLVLWRVTWFDLPIAAFGWLDRLTEAPDPRRASAVAAPRSGRTPRAEPIDARALDPDDSGPDPLEALQVGCFA